MAPRLVVDARLLHHNQTGIGRYLSHLYNALASLPPGDTGAFDVTVLYSRKDETRALHRPWPQQATAWTPPHNRFERWALAAEVARLRPALLHSPDHVAPQRLGWRSVVTVHDLAFRLMPESHAADSRRYYDGLERSVRAAQRVICVSEATKSDLLTAVPDIEPKVRVVYEAADPLYTVAGPRRQAERPYFIFVGTIEPRKNVTGIVRALATLPAERRPQLLIVGTPGDAADELTVLVDSLGLGSDVALLGRRPTAEVAALYRSALGLVFPSFLEGFGLPILEAMACGAPVITSDRSSMVEIAGGAAELVDPNDVDALAGAMDRLASDDAHRAALRERGLARAAQFSWARAAAQTVGVFREALA